MNQILYVQDKRNNAPIDTKKIVLFFAISIIIFGLIFLGQGAYSLYQNKLKATTTPQPGQSMNEHIPTITFTKTEDNKVIIDIESEVQISHIIYNWNNEASQTIEESGKTNIEEVIDIPAGENILNLTVIDANGKETKKQETYVIEQSKPIIELAVVGDDIKIKVTSKAQLSYITYKWNLEAETKEDMNTYENRNNFEKTISIPKGQNTLKVVAVDVNQVSSEKSQDIKGVVRAKTDAIVRGEYLEFTVTGEENIKTVEFTFNGEKSLMNSSTFGETKVVRYKVKMIEGMNYLKVVSTTQSGAVDTTVWKYEYKAQ